MQRRTVTTKRKTIDRVEIYDMYTYSAASDLELGAGGALLDLHGGGIGSEIDISYKREEIRNKETQSTLRRLNEQPNYAN